MNVSVTPELERFVQGLVRSGRYHSASEVFRDGLRLLEQAERRRLLEKWLTEGLTPEGEAQLPKEALKHARATIQAKIEEGLDAVANAQMLDGEEFFDGWKAKLKSLDQTHSTKQRQPEKRRK